MSSKKTALIILDGWGKGPDTESNAIRQAKTPFVDSLFRDYPNSELKTSGEDVGLPDGQMGNSEVGHLNIGAGRIVYQDLVKIHLAIRNGEFLHHPVFLSVFDYLKKSRKKLHLIGLVSDGGVHSHISHLMALCDTAKSNNISNVFIHAFTDGRDTDPKSGYGFIQSLSSHLKKSTGTIASVVGRYFAMDRDKRWERIKKAYDLLVQGTGRAVTDPLTAIQDSYNAGITDEFIEPIVITGADGAPLACIEEGDVVICFNFRTDRCREITEVLTQQDFPEQNMHRMQLYYVTMTEYDNSWKNIHVVFSKDNLQNTLGEVISRAGKTQLRIAETEKYPHVTFFFSGGREKPFTGENRILVPSPKVATYDLQPEMSAPEVTEKVCSEMSSSKPDFICLNFANSDMVGHTGVFPAVIKAVETVDACLKRVVETGMKNGYSFLITADHGNADYMINPDGSPNTAHTTNPVPLFLIHPDLKTIRNGRLADLAPTILNLMGMEVPSEMTGNFLAGSTERIIVKAN